MASSYPYHGRFVNRPYGGIGYKEQTEHLRWRYIGGRFVNCAPPRGQITKMQPSPDLHQPYVSARLTHLRPMRFPYISIFPPSTPSNRSRGDSRIARGRAHEDAMAWRSAKCKNAATRRFNKKRQRFVPKVFHVKRYGWRGFCFVFRWPSVAFASFCDCFT